MRSWPTHNVAQPGRHLRCERTNEHGGKKGYCDKTVNAHRGVHLLWNDRWNAHRRTCDPVRFGGRLTLVQASCGRCATITGALEREVLGRMWFAARAALGTRTRRKKDRRLRPMRVARFRRSWHRGRITGRVIQLPIFRFPACIDGRPYDSGDRTDLDGCLFELSEQAKDIAARRRRRPGSCARVPA
jgi:hypothetical protein